MKDKIQLIREKCIDVNPNIKDLAFGCKVKVSYKNQLTDFFITEVRSYEDETIYMSGITHYSREMLEMDNRYKIIGRPIRLADVLLAMKSEDIRWFEDQKRLIAGQKGHTRWDLYNDDLEKQSEETIEFLYDLMGGNAKEL